MDRLKILKSDKSLKEDAIQNKRVEKQRKYPRKKFTRNYTESCSKDNNNNY